MDVQKKIYTLQFGITCAAAMPGFTAHGFRIPLAAVERKITQVIWTMSMHDHTTGEPIPLETNNVLRYYLLMLTIPGSIANNIDPLAIVAATTGGWYYHYTPGQYKFDALVTSSEIRFEVYLRNYDPAAQIRVEHGFAIETEERAI